MFSAQTTGEPGAEEEECTSCGRWSGLLLAAVGGALLYMGADLMTGGALTRVLTGGLLARAPLEHAEGEEWPGDGEEMTEEPDDDELSRESADVPVPAGDAAEADSAR